MPRAAFTPLDPNTTTREAFTSNILAVPIPADAAQDWSDAVTHQQTLYRALYDHPAMSANRQQTFMTPANHKTCVYHLWDFVGRTLQFLYMVDPAKARSKRRGPGEADLRGRARADDDVQVIGGGYEWPHGYDPQ